MHFLGDGAQRQVHDVARRAAALKRTSVLGQPFRAHRLPRESFDKPWRAFTPRSALMGIPTSELPHCRDAAPHWRRRMVIHLDHRELAGRGGFERVDRRTPEGAARALSRLLVCKSTWTARL
jgi:hypothetical protein